MLQLLTIFCLPVLVLAASKIDNYNLYDKLFTGYNKDIRPVNQDSESIQVYLEFSLVSISELKEKDQTLISFGYIFVAWDDDFLSWNETDYNGISDLVVPQRKVWIPDIVVGNSVEKREKLGFDELPVRLNSGGYIVWSPSILFKTDCDIDVTYYPFDTQTCTIVLETMVSTKDELNLELNNATNPTILLDDWNINGQWDLVSTRMYEDDETYKSVLKVALSLKRRRTFYILNVILPILILSFMSSLTFALPSESGEKMGLSITVLLAYVVFLTIISDSMPQTSLNVSLLGVYITILLALSALSVLLSVPILRLHHKDKDQPVPKSIVSIAKFLDGCCRGKTNALAPSEKLSNKKTENLEEEFGPVKSEVTWKNVSNTIDGVFFCIFTTFTILFTIIFLIILS